MFNIMNVLLATIGLSTAVIVVVAIIGSILSVEASCIMEKYQ